MDRLISEQKVLKVIDNLKANFTCYDSVTLDEVASHVKAIPSAEPKTGHWIYWHTNGFGRKIYKCSKCNWDGDTAGYNFCPNCGCRMVEPQESEE